MSIYTVRVLLHGATKPQYEDLYIHMAAFGFSDIIHGSGTMYKMPQAEYTITTDADQGQVHDWAKSAAAKVAAKHAVLVTQSAGRTWSGLDTL